MRAIRYVLLTPFILSFLLACTEATPEGIFDDLSSHQQIAISSDQNDSTAALPSLHVASTGFQVWIHNVSNYRYSIISGAQLCTDLTVTYLPATGSYSNLSPIYAFPFITNGPNRICVLPVDSDGTVHDVSEAVEHTWTSDGIGPFIVSYNLGASYAVTPSAADTVELEVVFSEVIDPTSILASNFTSVGAINANLVSIDSMTLVSSVATIQVSVQDNSTVDALVQFMSTGVRDLAGNYTAGGTMNVAFTHDDQAPTPQITSPASASMVYSQSVTLSGACENGSSNVTISGDFSASPISVTCGNPAAGQFTANINLNAGAGNKALQVQQTDPAGNIGQGAHTLVLAAPAQLAATPATYSFGNLGIGHSVATTITIDNIGGTTATSLAAFGAGSFSVVGWTCGSTLAASGQCSIDVMYTPVAAATDSQNISFTYNDGAAPQTLLIPVDGTGVNNPVPVITSAACFYQMYYGQSANCVPAATGLLEPGDVATWSIQNSSCTWRSVDSGTGTIYGSPNTGDEGFCDFEVVVSDGVNTSAPWKIQHKVSATLATGLEDFTLSTNHGCGIFGGQPKCWGSNVTGRQLGRLGYTGTDYRPVSVLLAAGNQMFPQLKRVESGLQFNCGIDISGFVYCWGTGSSGQLGGVASNSDFATTGTNITDAVDIALGDSHACALRTNGQVVCWGSGANGSLGNGGVANNAVPQPVLVAVATPMTGVIAISAGSGHTCALKSDRKIYCWGANSTGAIGIDGVSPQVYAVPALYFGTAGGEKPAMAIDLGGNRSCAVLTNKTAYCWGDNAQGALGIEAAGNRGDGPSEMLGLPVIPLVGTVEAIASGGTHVCALMTGGVVKCWGANSMGQLGQGNLTARGSTSPQISTLAAIQLPTGASVLGVDLGNQHTCIKLNVAGQNQLYCFGINSNFNLGIDTAGASIGDLGSEMGNNLVPINFKAGLRLFVTSGLAPNGSIGGIAGADAFCQGHAQSAGYANYSSFKALIAKSAGPSQSFYQVALTFLPANDTAAIYDSLNRLISHNMAQFTDLSASISPGPFRTVNYNELGGAITMGSPIWTGSFDGTPDPGFTCTDWTSTSGLGDAGTSTSISTMLSDPAFGSGLSCTSAARFYCLGYEP